MLNRIRKLADKSFIVSVAGILLLLACGCSSFNREWKKAAQTAVAPDSMEGRWQGRWSSDANGHDGKLRCIVSRRQDGDYAARFRATYQKVLRFSYTVRLAAEHRDGAWHFRGEEDLGKLAGGVYHYEGTATITNFHSTYRSKYDHGIFEMKRPVR